MNMRDFNVCWRLTCLAVLLASVRLASAVPAGASAPALARARLPFMENTGWADRRVAYAVRTMAGMVYVTQSGELLYAMPRASSAAGGASAPELIAERILGAGPARLCGRQPAAARLSVFHGADPQRWHAGIPAFHAVEWGEARPGLHVTWRACGNNVEKIFTIMPGADPRDLRIELAGAGALRVDADGRLIAQTAQGN